MATLIRKGINAEGKRYAYKAGSGFSVTKKVGAAEFLNIVRTRPNSIKNSKIVLPKLGSNNLGEFLIEFR